MPVRITPSKLLLITYDSDKDEWVSIEDVSPYLLSEHVEIEPRVTIENIFQLIDRDTSLKLFLSEYCSCDMDSIREATPDAPRTLEVPVRIETAEDGRRTVEETAPIDTMSISPFYYVFTDDHTAVRRLEGGNMLLGKSSKHDSCFSSLGGPKAVTYSEIRHCFVSLECQMDIQECDTEESSEDDAAIAFSAHIRYTLLDVLATIVKFFGEPMFDPRYQKEIDEENEMWERFRRENEDTNSDEEQ